MRDLSSSPVPISARLDNVPLLSVIIPVRNLGNYLEPCLQSITAQPFRDIEIIAVDGDSDDGSREILEKLATDEIRLSVIHEKRIGPGVARNVGARHARGRYLWFVDGDDKLAPACLTPVSERLTSQRPDVLVVNHAVLSPDTHGSGLQAGLDDRLIAGAASDCSNLGDRLWLIDLRLVCWNKIVRREFFEACGTQFHREWPHEDVPVSCALLLGAGRISVLDHVCYHYRRGRPGSATSAGERDRHFRVFQRWLPILTGVRSADRPGGPVSEETYRRLFARSITHCASILEVSGYVVAADQRRFFRRKSALYRQCVPDGYRGPGGTAQVKFWLIARNFYLGYLLLGPLNRLRLAAGNRRSGAPERHPTLPGL
jgi:CDP-glycerol glycerophosphotransferase